MKNSDILEKIQEDCHNCKNYRYNDYYETYLCYNDRYCVDLGLWEPRETQPEKKVSKWV